GMIVGPGWFKDIVYKPGNPDIVYAAGYSLLDGNVFAKFYRSTDSGNSWTVMNSGIPVDAIGRMAIGVTEANPDIVYVNATDFYTGGFYGFYKSFDSGVSFNLQSSNPNIVLGQGAYNLVVAVSNDDPDLVFAGGVSLFKSTNGGVSWTETIGAEGSSNYVHVDMHDLQIVHSGTEEHLYVACDGGIFKSENLGQTWTDLSNGLPITQFYRLGMSAQNSHCILAGSQDNGAIFHDKRSSAWSNLFNSDVMECLIDPFYPDSVYFVVQGGRVWKSTDFGFETVIAPSDVGIYEGAAWTTPFVMHPNRPEELCIGYQSIWRTNNKGETWENFSGVLTNDNSVLRDIILAPSAPDQHVYATDGAAIFTTHDSGATWQTYMPPVANSFIKDIAVHNNIPTTLWICTSWGEVFKSTDGGANWTSVSGLLPQINANTIVHQKGSDDGIYVGMDVGIYYKDNSMSDWESFADDLPNVIVSELEIDYCNGKIVAATFGRGLWESDLAILDGFSAGIKCKVALEAPYDPGSQMMSTTLLDNQLIPLTHPYHVEPWNYLGNERVSALEEFPSNMVDWVLLELRSTDDFSVVSQKAALLLNDGYIIDVNGSEYVNFCGVDTESVYHLVVRHRNHLAIMSNSVVDFSNGNAFYDFTISEAQAMGNEQQKLSSNGNYMLHAGDLNSDGVITVSDLNFYTSEVSLFDMYLDSDCNMDRAVTVNDYNYYQLNTSIIGISQVRY
ncbi:MAG: WD40/YVTN/BNR-like repeat-containing protein, partial [Chitinophagales bacterium]